MAVDTYKTKGKFYSVILWQQIWIATGLDKMLSPCYAFFHFFRLQHVNHILWQKVSHFDNARQNFLNFVICSVCKTFSLTLSRFVSQSATLSRTLWAVSRRLTVALSLAHFGSESPSWARFIGSPGVRKSPRPPVWDEIPGWKPCGICCLVFVMLSMLYSMGRSANSVGTVPKKMPRWKIVGLFELSWNIFSASYNATDFW